MSFVYYYLVGQNINIITVDWKISLIINISIMSFIMTWYEFSTLRPIGLLIGWCSCIVINYSSLANSNTFKSNVLLNIYILLHTFEGIIFGLISLYIIENEGDPLRWVFVIVSHITYICLFQIINYYFDRISFTDTQYNYYIIYGVILLVSDLYFGMITLMSKYEHYISLPYIILLSIMTVISSIFIYEKTNILNNNNNNNDNSIMNYFSFLSSSTSTSIIPN